MFKTLCFQIALLLSMLACTSEKKETTTSTADTATAIGSAKTDIADSVVSVTATTFDDAKKKYEGYSKNIKEGRQPRHHCTDWAVEKDTLKSLSLPRDQITHHIPSLKPSDLPGFSDQYKGIRIYPYLEKSQNKYLVVYMRNSYDGEDSTTFRTINVKIDWCWLVKTLSFKENDVQSMMAHHLCDPRCPDESLLSF